MRQHAPKMLIFFFFWGKGESVGIFVVPIKFQLGSQKVLQVVSNRSSFLHPIFLTLSSTLQNLYVHAKGGDYNISILRMFEA